jgi:hypothetical protein
MNLSIKLIPQFKHKCPEGYSYEVKEFKKGVFSIWLKHHREYIYNDKKPVCTIWGYYSYKKCEFYSPVNSSTVGKVVKFENTTSYTSMPINRTVLESCFV